MSQTLNIQLSNQTYLAIHAEAESIGVPPTQLVTQTLERHFCNGSTRTELEKQAARERFERHFGEINLGMLTGAENDRIDADLAREYASNDEGV